MTGHWLKHIRGIKEVKEPSEQKKKKKPYRTKLVKVEANSLQRGRRQITERLTDRHVD